MSESSEPPRPKIDPESTVPSLSPVSAPRGRLAAGIQRVRRVRRRNLVLGCLAALGMAIVGSVLIFSALLPASDTASPTSTDTALPPTDLPTLAAIEVTATRVAPTSTRPRPSNTAVATKNVATDAATIEATSTSTTAATQAPTASPTQPPATGVGTSSDAANDLLTRINNLRSQNGLSAYRLNDALAAAAQHHSQDMANTRVIDHTGSDGSNARQRIQDAGYGSWPAGEIIFGGQVTLDDAWAFWSTDPPHLSALLSKQYREMGVGIVTAGNLTYYTVDFGGHPRQ